MGLSRLIRKPRSIQTKIFASYFIMILMLIGIVGFTSYSVYTDAMQKNIGESELKSLKQIAGKIHSVIQDMVIVTNNYYIHDTLRNQISHDQSTQDDPYLKKMNDNKINQLMREMNHASSGTHFESMIVTENDTYYSWNLNPPALETIRTQPWYSQALENNDKIVWLEQRGLGDLSAKNPAFFSLARALRDPYSNRIYGVLVLSVSERTIYETYKDTYPDSDQILVMNQFGETISSYTTGLLGRKSLPDRVYSRIDHLQQGWFVDEINDHSSLVLFSDIETIHWKLVQLIPLQKVFSKLMHINYLLLALFIICSLFAFVLSFVISKKITKPIHDLIAVMRQVEEGDFAVRVYMDTQDETFFLGKSFNSMIRQIEELLRNIKEQNEKKRLAEIKFLQAQINPHFLYNTLNTVKILSRLNRTKDINRVVVSLTKLLKYSIGSHTEFAAVNEEIEQLKQYIHIQLVRHDFRFRYSIEIEESVSSCSVLKLMLQPAVENSILHGYRMIHAEFHIGIRGYVHDGNILFEVTDNGAGMDERKLKQIREKLGSEKAVDSSRGIGLKNIHDHLMYHFGSQYGVTVSSDEGCGTTVRIKMPVIRATMPEGFTGTNRRL